MDNTEPVTEISFKYMSKKGIIEIWCRPRSPLCGYRVLREAEEITRSELIYDDSDRALRDALTWSAANPLIMLNLPLLARETTLLTRPREARCRQYHQLRTLF